jgi:dihydroorotate dehydrogenase electron transfer subunit
VTGRTPAPLGRRLVDVTGRRALGAYFVLGCADEDGPLPQPGQFYMLAAAERWGGGEDERPFLPRAFSVARAVEGGGLEFMLEDVGPGTRRLAELREGDGLWLLGPLGSPFAPVRDGRRAVLVGGGIGTAPLVILSEALDDPLVLLGFRGAEHAHGADLIPGAQVATDDGSVGHHGLVTDLIPPEDDIELLACGPPQMLEAVRAIAQRRGLPAQLALEAGMACGFGACFGCVVALRDGGYLRLCVDGPVLDAARLEAVHAH